MRPRFVRFSELDPESANRDLHMHTTYTDGAATVAEMIRRAEELGLDEIAITEHVRADTDWFGRFADEVREAGARSSVRVLVGAEARITDFEGTLDISPEIRTQCDLVLGSVHRFPARDGSRIEFDAVPAEAFAETEYRLALGLVARGDADVLAHPGGMSLKRLGAFPEPCFRSLMAECARGGMAIEISTSYLRDVRGFLALLGEADPPVSMGSDAHAPEMIGHCSRTLREVLWTS